MATRAQHIPELTGPFWDGDGTQIATPYAKFYIGGGAGSANTKDAYADSGKSVSFTKKALSSEGNDIYGDGIYDIEVYEGDPDASGTLAYTITNRKYVATLGNTTTKTTTYTATVDDTLILADTSGGGFTITLPAAADATGRKVAIQKISSDANTLTIAAASGETVDNAASVTISAQNAALSPVSDGSNWYGTQSQGNATTLGGVAASGYVKTDGSNPMDNNTFLDGRNAADSADISIVKINASDELEMGSSAVSWLPASPVKNNTTVKARNAADSANIDLAKANASDEVELGDPDNTVKVVSNVDPVARVGGTDYTFIHSNLMFSGRFKTDGTSTKLPSGWSLTPGSTGFCTVTHNLGTSNYTVVAVKSAQGGLTDLVVEVFNHAANTFTAHGFNLSGTDTDVELEFMLLLDT